jgi:hypothetical protein
MFRYLFTAAAAAALVATAATPAHAATNVTCKFVFTGIWPGGYMADLVITNRGPAITGWTTHWSVPVPTVLGSSWGAVMTMPTPYAMTAVNVSYNGTIATGATTSFGWTAIASSADLPTDITLNEAPC